MAQSCDSLVQHAEHVPFQGLLVLNLSHPGNLRDDDAEILERREPPMESAARGCG
jgi:hypothetical protein